MIAPLGTGSTLESRFLLSCLNMIYHADASRTNILTVIKWSFQALSNLRVSFVIFGFRVLGAKAL